LLLSLTVNARRAGRHFSDHLPFQLLANIQLTLGQLTEIDACFVGANWQTAVSKSHPNYAKKCLLSKRQIVFYAHRNTAALFLGQKFPGRRISTKMSTQGQSPEVECPVCHSPVTSLQHNAGCMTEQTREIVEVHPPEIASGVQVGGQQEVGADFFPVVSAAHEFKTPLVVMLGYTDLLRNCHLGPLNERQKEVLTEIQESTERLQKHILNLLLLSELKTGKARHEAADLEGAELNEHLEEIYKYWSAAARDKSITYQFKPAPGQVRVAVDSLELQHIVSNLIENALKFTPRNGSVTVQITPCFWERRKAQSEFLFNMERKSDRKIENAVRIDVTDTGKGIAPEYHRAIFLDFVQVPGTSSRGTGLGLAIARRMVEAHGGLIWVESELGKGSKFSLLLAQVR
jgi:nitrogen-specific signal transduction histidine kinase